MQSVKKILGIGVISITALSLSGCGLTSLSDEERYRPINNIKNAIDLPSSGEVIDQAYDANNGVFSPSIFVATIRGNGTYDILSKRIRAIPESLCNAPAVEQVSCTIGQVTVLLRRESEEDKDIGLRITDPYSGRKPE